MPETPLFISKCKLNTKIKLIFLPDKYTENYIPSNPKNHCLYSIL